MMGGRDVCCRKSPRRKHRWASVALSICAALTAAGCGGGGGSNGNAPPPSGPTPPATRVFADPAPVGLSVNDVEGVLARAVAEAAARGQPSTIAVVDRVGNVLAVYAMTGALPVTRIADNPSTDVLSNGRLQGAQVPASAAAISKALTGAYLSSGGNAFSTRTASMIVQQHFPPAPTLTAGLESGPLFGVQFSQLPCSDLMSRHLPGRPPGIGPNRVPLGLSADPGGFPLYRDGTLIGGVGVSSDDTYGFDPDVIDRDAANAEEAIALAAVGDLAAPETIRAERIFVDGTALRFSDVTQADLQTNPATAPAFLSLPPGTGTLVTVPGYYGDPLPTVLGGTIYGTESSGVRLGGFAAMPDAYVLSNGLGTPRFPATAGAAGIGAPLTAAEVNALLEESFAIVAAARAQIRQPLGSRAQVTVSVVDTNGNILGIVRAPDAPIFGIDVSLQKARSAAFFSHPLAATDLSATTRSGTVTPSPLTPDTNVRDSVSRVRSFLVRPTALSGDVAIAARTLGNLARPFFPDGEVGNGPGPLSVPVTRFNPFDTGLQSDLIADNIVEHVLFVSGATPTDTRAQCTFLPDVAGGAANRLGNGLQIFPGGVPIMRNGQLVGGIGVSGDGIDQDDMVAFLGLHNAGLRLGGAIGNAPTPVRADQIVVPLNGRNARLRYVNCPFSPFIGATDQNVCQGK